MNINHNRSTKHTLKRHVQKSNETFFWTKSFEQQCVIIHALLNQGEAYAHCSFIGLNDAYFNSQCLSNEKRLFSENLLPKNHSQESFDKKSHQDAVMVSFTTTPPSITIAIHIGEEVYSPNSSYRKGFSTEIYSLFVFNYR